MALPVALHPVLLFLYSSLLVTNTAAFTDRGSRLRYVALVLLFALAVITPYAIDQFTNTTGWAGRVPTGAILWNVVTCFDRLVLRDWDYHHYGPTEDPEAEAKDSDQTKKTNRFPGSRMDFGSEVSGLARGIGRFWQVKNIPNFSIQNPELVPTPGAFILVQSVAIVLCYFINNWTVAATFRLDPQLLGSEYVPFWTRLSQVTMLELKIRFVASIGYWVVQYCNLQFFYSFFGLIGAIFQPRDIMLWRPLFGSPKDAYTLRNFWGVSWHQTLRSGLEGCSNFLAHDVLHLPSHGLLQRYSKIFFSFALSGIMHIFADMGGGLAMHQSGALQFFCMQALGIMIEDGVQAVYGQSMKGRRTGPNVFERSVGYAWVLLYFVWTSPVWVFPATLQMKEDEAMLNFSALKPLLRWGSS